MENNLPETFIEYFKETYTIGGLYPTISKLTGPQDKDKEWTAKPDAYANLTTGIKIDLSGDGKYKLLKLKPTGKGLINPIVNSLYMFASKYNGPALTAEQFKSQLSQYIKTYVGRKLSTPVAGDYFDAFFEPLADVA